jgi:hypothetical protein
MRVSSRRYFGCCFYFGCCYFGWCFYFGCCFGRFGLRGGICRYIGC